MQLHTRIKYVEGGELKSILKEVGSFADALDWFSKFAVDGIVVTEAHIFYMG